MGLLHHPFWLQLVLARSGHLFSTFENTLWLRITDEGSVPEMRIWSILLIKSVLKWCIHLSRSLFYIVTCFRNTVQLVVKEHIVAARKKEACHKQ